MLLGKMLKQIIPGFLAQHYVVVISNFCCKLLAMLKHLFLLIYTPIDLLLVALN
jgi:hypothetical protein